MKHYFNPMSRAITTRWMLLEADVPHEQVFVDITNGDTDRAEYRAVNPMGKIPALLDGDVVVTEAAAICAYIADKFPEKGLAPAPGTPARGSYYRYLFVPGTTLEPMFTIASLGIKDYPARSVGFGDMERCLATIEAMTPETGWAIGDRFTAADVVFGGFLDMAVQFAWLPTPSAKVSAYVGRVRARPAYQKSRTSENA
ncbi:glutathione S-transferase family protein [Kordiimonas gwangyangensis]|uniref:glutathione S-transferase family protein n=2 Tax=Kordiimonas gwangyangensis TaxID=288022 RepID=UPI00037D109F|nr:glutathione S-transferase family protein [Kordiimonas gwangyangensis]